TKARSPGLLAPGCFLMVMAVMRAHATTFPIQLTITVRRVATSRSATGTSDSSPARRVRSKSFACTLAVTPIPETKLHAFAFGIHLRLIGTKQTLAADLEPGGCVGGGRRVRQGRGA